MKVVTVIPTYNEAGNLGALIEGLFAQPIAPYDLRVLVVDDASPDGTADVARTAGGRWAGRVEVLQRPAKQGLASAYVCGFEHALRDGAACVAQIDADGSHDPAALPGMLAAMAGADLVIGSRYAPGDSRDCRQGSYRRLVSRLGNRVVARLIRQQPISDPTSGFRLWRRAALLCIDPARRVRSRAYGFQVEMAFLAALSGCRIAEIPIHFRERQTGRSKMTVGVQLRTICEIATLSWAHRRVGVAVQPDPGEGRRGAPEIAEDAPGGRAESSRVIP